MPTDTDTGAKPTGDGGKRDGQGPAAPEAGQKPAVIRALEWIGLDLTGPERASALQIGIYALLVFIPIAVAVRVLHLGEQWLFITSAAAIIPLAKILGTATEELAARVGPGVGGLLNATFGNAVEMIIAFFALQAGLFEVVKASITGSILGNVLFVLGLAMFMGGLGREKQRFNRTAASASASQLTLAVVGLVIPAAFLLTSPTGSVTPFLSEELSLGVAFVLMGSYVAQLIFSLRTHKHLYSDSEEEVMHGSAWSIRHSVSLLIGATVTVAVMSEMLVEGVEYLTEQLNFSELFVGVILVAIIGNAAEHLTAVVVATKDKMDLAVNIAMGSALQVALFVAPVLVFLGFIMGKELNLMFNLFEVVSVMVTLFIVSNITQDGESNWFEGLQLLAAYTILAVAFFFHP